VSRPLVDPDVLTQAARPLPVVVIFDWSWSMRAVQGDIATALRALPDEFERKTVLRNSGEIALITMGRDGVVLRTGDPSLPPYGFVPASRFVAPAEVVCDGVTELDVALELAVDVLERRCRQCVDAGRSIYRPYIAIISDGDPTDADGEHDETRWRAPAQRMREAIGGTVLVEAFVPAATRHGILTELVDGEDHIHQLDPAALANVLEVVSFSVACAATAQPPRRAADVVREDIAAGDAETGRGGA
jgi:uncharacterized protein YegL